MGKRRNERERQRYRALTRILNDVLRQQREFRDMLTIATDHKPVERKHAEQVRQLLETISNARMTLKDVMGPEPEARIARAISILEGGSK